MNMFFDCSESCELIIEEYKDSMEDSFKSDMVDLRYTLGCLDDCTYDMYYLNRFVFDTDSDFWFYLNVPIMRWEEWKFAVVELAERWAQAKDIRDRWFIVKDPTPALPVFVENIIKDYAISMEVHEEAELLRYYDLRDDMDTWCCELEVASVALEAFDSTYYWRRLVEGVVGFLKCDAESKDIAERWF